MKCTILRVVGGWCGRGLARRFLAVAILVKSDSARNFQRMVSALLWLVTIFANQQNPRVFCWQMEGSDEFRKDLDTAAASRDHLEPTPVEMQSFTTVALSEVIGMLQSRNGLHLPNLRRRLKKPNGGGQGVGRLDNRWSMRELSPKCVECVDWYRAREYKFNVVENQSSEVVLSVLVHVSGRSLTTITRLCLACLGSSLDNHLSAVRWT